MLFIDDFENYLKTLVAFIPEIERSEVVIDDSQVNKFLEEIPDDGKYIAMGIIPKHNQTGDADTIQSVDYAAILILKKVTRSDQDHTVFKATILEAQKVTRNVILKMREDKIDDENECSVMKFLTIESLDLNPIWGLAGCDGYQIDFSLKTHF